MKEQMAAFFCQWQCCGFVATMRDRKLFGRNFKSCVVQKIMHPRNVRQTHWLDPVHQDWRCNCWMRGEDMLKKCLIYSFYVQCKFRAIQYKKKLYSSVGKIIGLCLGIGFTELHGSGSFVKHIDPSCAINQHDCVLQFGCHSVCPRFKLLDTFEF